MFISAAYAQTATGGGATGELLVQFVPIIAIIAIMYFLVFRPQQQRMKAHQELVAGVKRGDVVVTSGGIIGKVVKVLESDEVVIEIAEDVRIRVVKSTLADVRSKTEPVEARSRNDDDDKK